MDKTEYIPSHALRALRDQMSEGGNDKGFFACASDRMAKLVDAIEYSERIRWQSHELTRQKYLDALDDLEDATALADSLEQTNSDLWAEIERLQEAAKGGERFDPQAWLDGVDSGEPQRYLGDGQVTCARAMRSMFCGWDIGCGEGDTEAFFWAGTALKYIWRFPLKGHPAKDLEKAIDCLKRALKAWSAVEGE